MDEDGAERGGLLLLPHARARRFLGAVRVLTEADLAWFWDAMPCVWPSTWRTLETGPDGFAMLVGTGLDPMTVIVSGAVERDGRRWIHLSAARPKRLPSWEDLVLVRDVVLGRDAKALHVLAPIKEHVNIHQHCLHLWHCVDGDGLPDFTRGGKTL